MELQKRRDDSTTYIYNHTHKDGQRIILRYLHPKVFSCFLIKKSCAILLLITSIITSLKIKYNKLIFHLSGGYQSKSISEQPFRMRLKSLVLLGVFPTFKKVIKYVFSRVKNETSGLYIDLQYQKWRTKNMPTEVDFKNQKLESDTFKYRPLVSILIPVYDPPLTFLIEAVESVFSQTYSNWEICISDDNSSDQSVLRYLRQLDSDHDNIHVNFRSENGHISKNSNDALRLAKGEYVALFDHDDLLNRNALFEVVKVLNEEEPFDFIYSDEDKVDESGNYIQPHFKPDFCLDNLLSRNYICHFSVIKTELINRIGGFRVGYEGSQDHDLFLRVVSKTEKIHHIPKILYSWRMHANSAALVVDQKPYASIAGEKAVAEFLKEAGEPAIVKSLEGLPGMYQIRYELLKKGKVSIIIPTKNQSKVLKVCIDSIINVSTYQDFEIILLDNNSNERDFFDLVENYKNALGEKFVYVKCAFPFNYSKLMNIGADHSSGKYILLLNNDTEVITPDWMEAMMEQCQREKIGCVGVKLLYHNDTIQHAGVVLGIGGVGSHSFVGMDKDASGYFWYLKVISNYSAVTAACLMVRAVIFKTVGFDEQLEIEYNDVDFCLRVKAEGYRNVYLPHVTLYHYESLSRGNPLRNEESRKRHERESGIVYERWRGVIEKDPCYSPNLTLSATDFSLRV